MTGRVLLEVCVDSAAGLRAAVAGGADRIELCAALELGGLTPPFGLMRLAARCGVPVRAMIRPRAGDFVFDADEIRIMEEEIAAVRAAGLDGIVLGAAVADGMLDRPMLERLVRAADGLGMTLHRVVDLLPDPVEAVAIAASLDIDTVLTSGGANSAAAGAETIAAMAAASGGAVTVMPGGGVRASTVADLLARTQVRAVHASCATPIAAASARAVELGFAATLQRRTDEAEVARLRAALDDFVERSSV